MKSHAAAAALKVRLEKLSVSQLAAIESIVAQFERSFDFVAERGSDLVDECVLRELGDTLRLHHCFSAEPFTKDKLEHAMERTLRVCGKTAQRAPRGNPGHDLTVAGTPFSLKTQADANIRRQALHISKFMELGKGQWGDRPEDLVGLRGQFFRHMQRYDRILTLRYFGKEAQHEYQLVEIPKTLLLEAAAGALEMKMESKQSPKPGTCTVTDGDGVRFQLYFDGGTERKLQIRHIRMTLCRPHATWRFPKDVAISEATTL